MKNIIVVGFGRMGLTHAIILSGLLGVKNVKFTIIDPGFSSRLIAKLLFPTANVLRHIKDLNHKKLINKFNYALITTPPNIRSEISEIVTEISEITFLEKPVLSKIVKSQMSGYVLQHAPLNILLRNILESLQIRKVRAVLNTNLNFEDVKSGWRSSKYGSVLHEFGGHILSVMGTCLIFKGLFENKFNNENLEVDIMNRNTVKFSFIENETMYQIYLNANNEKVRKASYQFTFFTDDDEIEYDLYTIKSKNNRFKPINLANQSISVNYYLRGFEFTAQMNSMIKGTLDELSSNQIWNFETILKYVEEINENNIR